MIARSAQFKRKWVSLGSIAALALGFTLGTLGHESGTTYALDAAALLKPLGSVWLNALRMVVVPLVVAQLVFTLALAGNASGVGRIASASFLVFAALLIIGGAVTITVVPIVLAQIEFAPDAIAALRSASVSLTPPPAAAARTGAELLTGLVPPNVFRAASQDDLLGLMVFAIAFGLAVGRMPAPRREPVGEFFRTVADAMMTIVGWILWIMPLAVFSLALGASSTAGIGAVAVIAMFVVLMCAVLFAFTLLQYPIAALLGGVSMRRFAVAAFPVQLLAIGTRSSVASLPLLLERGRDALGLRPEVPSVVMPLAVSSFKINRAVSSPFQFLFLAYVYGIDLSAAQVVTFTTFAIVMSFTTLGIPSGGLMMRSAPLYLAAGIPIEGYLLVEAAESIPDIFKTLLNVTGNMTAATIVNRATAAPASVPAGVPEGEIAAGV